VLKTSIGGVSYIDGRHVFNRAKLVLATCVVDQLRPIVVLVMILEHERDAAIGRVGQAAAIESPA
jgi:hypothetical protein